MKAVCQRVTQASVSVDAECVGSIGPGMMVLLGIGPEDNEAVARAMAAKIAGLRIFADEADRMNLSLVESLGACLVVSQFTLYGDCKKGRRPFFGGAAKPEVASHLCDVFTAAMRDQIPTVETGRFGAMMDVSLHNDGPVTLILDSNELGFG